MPKCLRLLGRFWNEVDLDLNFEFAPSGLDNLIGRVLDRADILCVRLMEFELYFL